MKQVLITSILLASCLGSFAQNGSIAENGCGTVTTEKEMQQLAAYLASGVAAKTTTPNDTIPLSIHIVGQDNGTGYYKLDNLFKVLCDLNDHYAPVGFFFYIKWPINYINNSSFYNHDTWSGYQMMTQNNVSNSVNVYFVEDPSGACGYFSPGADGIAIAKGCGNPNSTTLVHELGHYFGLPHTFYGWEGGGTPANPEKVTRGAGANCSTTGDLFCDTDADYLANRWFCPYTGSQLDVTGTPYRPDSSLYMSYATDACMSRFSNQQIGRMQNKLHNDRSYLLGPTPSNIGLTEPQVIYPTDSVYANNTTLKWKKVPGADQYHVKITFNTIPIVKQESITGDTSLLVNFAMQQGVGYKLIIMPLNAKNVCKPVEKVFTYFYSSSTPPLSVGDMEENSGSITLYPNPTNKSAQLDLSSVSPGDYTLQVTSINGQKLYETVVSHRGGSQKVSLPVESLAVGIYIVRLTGNNNSWTEKLMIQK